MISYLASPSVCVIDDEEDEYTPIISALVGLGVGCVHLRGRSGDPLPPKPFDAVRLVFTDLHLSGQVGKAAASHTANVFKKVVSAESGPVLVVIWSKYADDKVDLDLPPNDQPTEADLFREELLAADSRFRSRLVFVEMRKPKTPDRPEQNEWIGVLQDEIKKAIEDAASFGVLWTWESLLRRAGADVNETLIDLAAHSAKGSEKVSDRLKTILKLLAQQQGGPDNSDQTACRHLMTVFSQIGMDLVEARSVSEDLLAHSPWLAEALDDEVRKSQKLTKLNAFLHTSSATPVYAEFMPGTVYDVTDVAEMEKMTGFRLEKLQADCFDGKPEAMPDDFKEKTSPVFIEITPACDFHQGNRRCATLLAGLVWPDGLKKVRSGDAWKKTPPFEDRYLDPPSDVGLVFCGRYRFTVALDPRAPWLRPRFRLRDSLVADIRGWHAGQASRAGYLSFF